MGQHIGELEISPHRYLLSSISYGFSSLNGRCHTSHTHRSTSWLDLLVTTLLH
jgi:hypothetical protein